MWPSTTTPCNPPSPTSLICTTGLSLLPSGCHSAAASVPPCLASLIYVACRSVFFFRSVGSNLHESGGEGKELPSSRLRGGRANPKGKKRKRRSGREPVKADSPVTQPHIWRSSGDTVALFLQRGISALVPPTCLSVRSRLTAIS